MRRLEEIEKKLLMDYRIYKKWVLIMDIKKLLSEIHRLKAAILEHQETIGESAGIADRKLYKALEEE